MQIIDQFLINLEKFKWKGIEERLDCAAVCLAYFHEIVALCKPRSRTLNREGGKLGGP
jgi:hypothetical protein